MTTAAPRVVPGYARVEPPVPGSGPIKSVIVFGGVIFALRDDHEGMPVIWRAVKDGWERVTLAAGDT